MAIFLSLSFCTYLLLSEPLPAGKPGPAADQLAQKMMDAVGADNLSKSNILAWTFKDSHHFVWDRERNLVEVKWGDNRVLLNLDQWEKGKAYENGREVGEGQLDKKRGKAWEIFVNDSFWFIAPTKAFDEGVQRSVTKDEDGNDALLLTYSSGGVTPGDSYLWILDESGLPKAFKMWVSIIPIGGLKATWEEWEKLGTGLKVATEHNIGPLSLSITNTAAAQTYQELKIKNDPFAAIL